MGPQPKAFRTKSRQGQEKQATSVKKPLKMAVKAKSTGSLVTHPSREDRKSLGLKSHLTTFLGHPKKV